MRGIISENTSQKTRAQRRYDGAVAEPAEDRITTLERENAELRERNEELEAKLYAKIEAHEALQQQLAQRPAVAAAGRVPGLVMMAGGLVGVAGAFAANVLAMLGGLVMLSAGVWWGRQEASRPEA